jgi:iron complex outermembrane receptor protein
MGRLNIRRKPGDLLNRKFNQKPSVERYLKNMKKISIIIIILFSVNILAQYQSKKNFVLDSVFLYLPTDTISMNTYRINQLRNTNRITNLSEIIQEQTNIFVREYGKGMISGISIRGTGSQHTQIVWNGIPLNSILLGSTDLNTIYLSDFEQITIKKGGSSVDFGSGAIGGIILLNNTPVFKPGLSIENNSQLGSFQSVSNNFKLLTSNDKIYLKFNFQINRSKNDYTYPGFNIINENGAYQGLDYAFSTGYKINKNIQIYLKTQFNNLDRELSRSLYKPEKAKLFTQNHRNIFGLYWKNKSFYSQTDIAYLYENFRYFFNKNSTVNTRSFSNIYYLKNISGYKISPDKNIVLGNELEIMKGNGEHIGIHQRNKYAIFGVWSQRIQKLDYRIKLRQEIVQNRNIPPVGAVEINYHFNKQYRFRLNLSNNFRLPTFNDLYWTPGGNPNLLPEKNFSIESGFDINYTIFDLHLTGFYINSSDLIKWIPTDKQIWQPVNFDKIIYKGLELETGLRIKLKQLRLTNNLQFTYQLPVNRNTGKILTYTPQILAQNIFQLNYKKFNWQYTGRYQGKMFTTANNSRYLSDYLIHNTSFSFQINDKIRLKALINNVLNTYYESFPSRPQPGRNYQLIINYKIT